MGGGASSGVGVPAGADLAEVRFAVVDVETTGLQPRTERVIEVAVWVIDAMGSVESKWATLVRPDDRELTGRLVALADAPTFSEIAGDLCHQLSRGTVAGHNVGFDLRFLDAELRRIGVALPDLDYFDTHAVATSLTVDTPNRSLAVLCHELGVPFVQWHTAEGDVEATAALVARLVERARGWGHRDVDRFLSAWTGKGESWPTLERTGRSVRRDPLVFPPGGRQPGNVAVFRPSWRRAGTGPSGAGGDGSVKIEIGLGTDLLREALIGVTTARIDEREPDKPWPEDWDEDWVAAADEILTRGPEAEDAAYMLGLAWMIKASEGKVVTAAGQVRRDWVGGEFRGMEGITELERIAGVLETEGGEDQSLAEVCAQLADLYGRHGGRHSDVVATYRRALDAASRCCGQTEPEWEEYGFDDEEEEPAPGQETGENDRGDTAGYTRARGYWSDEAASTTRKIAEAWWSYLQKRRAVAELVELFDLLQAPTLRMDSISAASMARWMIADSLKQGEITVALELQERLLPAWESGIETGELAAATERIAAWLAAEGRSDEAIAFCERAWTSGWADQCIANRHSLILERLKANLEAVSIAESGLQLTHDEAFADALVKRIARCRKRAGVG